VTDAVAEPGVGDAPNLVPPPGNPRFPLFDSLRALAALSVFAGHTVTGVYTFTDHPGRFLWAVDLAYEGVAIFFLISGFLLYRPFLAARRGGRPVRLGSYAIRRVLRIVPAYWVALTIFIAAGFVTGVTTSNWWIFYAFGQIYSPGTIGDGIGVAWTLCIEVTFYAALPVFALVCAWLAGRSKSFRPDVVLLVLLAAGSLAFRAHFSAFTQVATVSTLAGTFFWFALGMGLAICSVWLEQRAARPSGSAAFHQLWPVASWAAAIGLLVLNHEVQKGLLGIDARGAVVLGHALYGLSALFVLLPAVFAERRAGPVQSLLRLRLLAWIGLISYGFYLYHTIVIDQLNKLAKDAGISARYVLVAVCSLLVTLACAAVSYYLLERPIMRWGRRASRLRAGTSANGSGGHGEAAAGQRPTTS
jgi:peptidoglycan/LPS O-acetylase OafA/YrhL